MKYVLYLSSFALALVYAGCNHNENDEASGKEYAEVRVLTTVQLTQFSQSGTRTEGLASEPPFSDGFKMDTEEGKGHENHIGSLRVIAFERTTGDVQANIKFRKSGVTPEPGERNFTYSNDSGAGRIQVDFKILTGDYTFILVANEETSWNLAEITSYPGFEQSPHLKSVENSIVSAMNLSDKAGSESGIPMIGKGLFTVLPGGTVDNPQVISPVVELKRTIAKVEVYLTNKNDEAGNEIFETASILKIKSINLIHANQRYNIREDDLSAVSETEAVIFSEITHETGAPFSERILESYIAERKDVNEADAVIARITVAGLDDEKRIYDVPLYQLIHGAKNYNIYRNTLYRLKCILKGSTLKITMKILPWHLFATEDNSYAAPVYEQPVVDVGNLTLEGERKIVISASEHKEFPEIKFRLNKPDESTWAATITNGMDFDFFKGKMNDKTYDDKGIAVPAKNIQGNQVTDNFTFIKVIPRNPDMENTSYETELYITVDGKEIPLTLKKADNTTNTLWGSGNRLIIKQIK